ncbi:MAG: YlxR family protein [Anaerolineae bacterium]|nr:YlxR family protein [Anaerolineae bacterium]
MSRRAQRRKHVPQRTCIACRTVRPRRDLVRIVRTPEGVVMLDETGKRNGRGAYLCRQRGCLETALQQQQLERVLKTSLTAEVESELREYAQGLPPSLPTESGENEQ